jgi:ABC-type sugar transport system permease subunit
MSTLPVSFPVPGTGFAPRTWARAWRYLRSARARHQFWGYVFIMPMLVLMLAFKFIPAIEAFRLSFTSYDLLSPPRFIGLQNYISLLEDPLFHQSIQATMYFVLGAAAPVWVVSLGLALVFTLNLPWKSFLRTIYFLPHIVPAVVFAIIWRFMFHPYGVLNAGLEFLNLPTVDWINDVRSVIPAFILMTDSTMIPFFMIIYLTAIQNIPREYYEAAKIDGAGAWQRFSYITVPLLRPTFLLVVVISIISLSKVFTSVVILTGGGPDGASRVLPMFIYQMGLEYFKMGRASSASMFFLVGLMVFTIIQLTVFKDDRKY